MEMATLTDNGVQHDQGQYLVFVLGKDLFAINILVIKEITEVGRLTTVPRMPDFIRGVVNLRGAVVPVVDLGALFGKPAMQLTRRTCIVIIELGTDDGSKQDVGVMVDGVSAVVDIPKSEIEPPPSFGANIRVDFIGGVGVVNDEFVIILNVDQVLEMDETAALVGIASGSGGEGCLRHALAA